ncbi:MAG TPA: hypothetical protein VGO57_09620 [Verrucomicrobiae bacterium]|jgi:hypothetical protein
MGNQTRDLKCTLPSEVFGAVQWAAKRAGNPPGTALPLADFLSQAIQDKLRAIVKEEIGRGKNVPPDVAAAITHHEPSK